MRIEGFVYFTGLQLLAHKARHLGILIVTTVIVFLMSAVLFVSSSIEVTIGKAMAAQPDFVVSRLQAGESVVTPLEWVDRIGTLEGVLDLSSRVYGRYFYAPNGQSFLVMGIDLFASQSHAALRQILNEADLKPLATSPGMLIGEGVREFLEAHHYHDSFHFKTPQGALKRVSIVGTLPQQANLLANDLVILPIDVAREILGVPHDRVTDIVLTVPNDAEWEHILAQIHLLFFDAQVVDRHQVERAYASLFDYKGGFFMVIYLVVLATFMMMLYLRYTSVYALEKREIGILRALGWQIGQVIRQKFLEAIWVILLSYLLGVTLAYFYVYLLDAPILRTIFLGGGNLANDVAFAPVIDGGLLGAIFLLILFPFVTAVVVPVWRIAVTPPTEAMR
jgi:ABC-type lipoprotein release transport system permease subunit